MLPSYHRNAQQILCKGQERNGWEDTQGKRRGKRRNAEVTVSTHTVTVICRKREVCPSANVLPSNPRKPLQQRGSKTLLSQKMESQLVYTRTGVWGRKQHQEVTSESTVERCNVTMKTVLGWLLLLLLCSLAPKGRSSDLADEKAERWRNLQRACSAQEAQVSFLCSQISSITGDSILKAQLPARLC